MVCFRNISVNTLHKGDDDDDDDDDDKEQVAVSFHKHYLVCVEQGLIKPKRYTFAAL